MDNPKTPKINADFEESELVDSVLNESKVSEPVGQAEVALTDSAAQKVQQLRAEEDNSELMLRVYITGGGCAGFSYGFTFDEVIKEGDTQVENGGVTLLIDSLSIQYLAGAKIDYKEGLMGSQFVVDNPNASTTCGCGSSFSI